MPVARGNFDIRLASEAVHGAAPDGLGRMSIDKQFFGDLTGTSHGEMLAMNDAVANTAVYVALERVEGALDGRSGSFWLAHRGTMYDGESVLEVHVVPGSGGDEFVGLAGSMTIDAAANHSYTFEYELPGP